MTDDRGLVTVQIFYVIPGFRLIINDFLWQTFDLRPRYPRIHCFLDYWHREIDAVIKEIIIFDSLSSTPNLRHGTLFRI